MLISCDGLEASAASSKADAPYTVRCVDSGLQLSGAAPSGSLATVCCCYDCSLAIVGNEAILCNAEFSVPPAGKTFSRWAETPVGGLLCCLSPGGATTIISIHKCFNSALASCETSNSATDVMQITVAGGQSCFSLFLCSCG